MGSVVAGPRRAHPLLNRVGARTASGVRGRKLGTEGGPRLREALALVIEHEHQADRAEILEALAQLETDRDVAAELYREALTIYEERGLIHFALATRHRLAELA